MHKWKLNRSGYRATASKDRDSARRAFDSQMAGVQQARSVRTAGNHSNPLPLIEAPDAVFYAAPTHSSILGRSDLVSELSGESALDRDGAVTIGSVAEAAFAGLSESLQAMSVHPGWIGGTVRAVLTVSDAVSDSVTWVYNVTAAAGATFFQGLANWAEAIFIDTPVGLANLAIGGVNLVSGVVAWASSPVYSYLLPGFQANTQIPYIPDFDPAQGLIVEETEEEHDSRTFWLSLASPSAVSKVVSKAPALGSKLRNLASRFKKPPAPQASTPKPSGGGCFLAHEVVHVIVDETELQIPIETHEDETAELPAWGKAAVVVMLGAFAVQMNRRRLLRRRETLTDQLWSDYGGLNVEPV